MTDKAYEVKARFKAEGVSVAEWARASGFNPRLVYRVLDGSVRGTRGQAHKVAVALGLKRAPRKVQFRSMVDAA